MLIKGKMTKGNDENLQFQNTSFPRPEPLVNFIFRIEVQPVESSKVRRDAGKIRRANFTDYGIDWD